MTKYVHAIISIFLVSFTVLAGPQVTSQGRIFKPDGTPMESSSVQFRIQVRSPGAENCLLYEELQTIDMQNSSGVFAVTLNDGTGSRLDTATYTFDRIFANRDVLTLDSTRCVSGTTYTPGTTDGRKLITYFKDSSMTAYEPMPISNLQYVPQALYALESQKIERFPVTSLLRAVDGSSNPTTVAALTPAQITEFLNVIGGTSTKYVASSTTAGMSMPQYTSASPPSSPVEGSIWYDSTDKQVKYYNGDIDGADGQFWFHASFLDYIGNPGYGKTGIRDCGCDYLLTRG